MPIIDILTFAGVTLGTGQNLDVLPWGGIVAPSLVIDGITATGQRITIAGFVDVNYIWLGGSANLTITASGVFHGHSPWPIYMGSGTGVDVGRNVITNAGLITGDASALRVFGQLNQIANSGSITAATSAIITADAGLNTVQNSGTISSRDEAVIDLRGVGDSLSNTGTVTGFGTGVRMGNASQLLDNSGHIMSGAGIGVVAENSGQTIQNSGTITANLVSAIKFQNAPAGALNFVINSGSISGSSGVESNSADLNLTNSGSIDASSSIAVSVVSTNLKGTTSITNTGTITAVTTAIFTGAETDYLRNTGTIHGDISLGGGNDQIDTRGGTVRGIINGGIGSDVYVISDASVTLLEGAGDSGDRDMVKSTVSYQLEANFEVLSLIGGADINGTGNGQGNVMTGNSGDNRISGLDGSDSILGLAGDDVLLGGLLNDTLLGGDGDDRLRGGSGLDSLQGGDGDDILTGGTGRDTMTGATGADVFVFLTLSDTDITQANADVITDFTQGADLIDLSRLDAKSATAANDAFSFIGSGPLALIAGQVHAVQSGPYTYVEYDVTGDGVADGIIRLNGLFTLTAADFVL